MILMRSIEGKFNKILGDQFVISRITINRHPYAQTKCSLSRRKVPLSRKREIRSWMRLTSNRSSKQKWLTGNLTNREGRAREKGRWWRKFPRAGSTYKTRDSTSRMKKLDLHLFCIINIHGPSSYGSSNRHDFYLQDHRIVELSESEGKP